MNGFVLHKQNIRRYKADLAHVRPSFRTRDGEKLTMRLMREDDVLLLVDFFYRLSPEARARRFHTNVEHVSEDLVAQYARELVQVDNQRVMGALIALNKEADGEHVVGSVRLARDPATPDSPVAEAAIVVRDDYQGRGVGQELLRRMVLLAKHMKVTTILAIFQPNNEGAVRLFRELNLPFTMEIRHGDTEMRIEVPQG